MGSAGFAIGIDLGTENTRTAVFRNNTAEIVPHDGQFSMPSCVAFTETVCLVGSAAKKQAEFNPQNTIYNALMFVGIDGLDPRYNRMVESMPFFVWGKEGRPTFVVESQGQKLTTTPLEILAMILARAQEDAQIYLGSESSIIGAVITIPANFNFCQRQTVWDAACAAKVNPLRLISATASTCAEYAVTNELRGLRNILCIDYGARSLDVAVATIDQGAVEIKAVDAVNFVGGADFDLLLARYMAKVFKRKWDVDLTGKARARQRLHAACEQAKRELTFQKRTQIKLKALAGGRDFENLLTQKT
jgi:molecular chaperone DnaK (HSP70)